MLTRVEGPSDPGDQLIVGAQRGDHVEGRGGRGQVGALEGLHQRLEVGALDLGLAETGTALGADHHRRDGRQQGERMAVVQSLAQYRASGRSSAAPVDRAASCCLTMVGRRGSRRWSARLRFLATGRRYDRTGQPWPVDNSVASGIRCPRPMVEWPREPSQSRSRRPTRAACLAGAAQPGDPPRATARKVRRFTLVVSVNDTEPRIWRRSTVAGDLRLMRSTTCSRPPSAGPTATCTVRRRPVDEAAHFVTLIDVAEGIEGTLESTVRPTSPAYAG